MKRLGLLAAVLVAVLAAGCASKGDAGKGAPPADPWKGSGFSVWEHQGAMWIFREGAKELDPFMKGTLPAKPASAAGTGLWDKKTLKAADKETLDVFAAWKPGFSFRYKDGKNWVFQDGSKALADFEKAPPAKPVSKTSGSLTLWAADQATFDAWAAAK